MRITSLIAGGLLPTALAVPAARYELNNRRTALRSRYIKGQAAASAAFVPARIALKQQNVDRAERILHEISDPDSPKYGQHLTPTEIANLFAPSQDSIDSVKSWLTASGVSADSIKVSNSHGWIHFNTTAGQLGSLLNTKYHQYTAVDGPGVFFGTESYSLPAEISPVVDFVYPATEFSAMEKRRNGKTTASPNDGPTPVNPDPNSLDTCDKYMTPKCIAAQYGIPEGTSARDGNELGIFEIYIDEYAQEDLDQFFAAMTPKIPKGTSPIVHNVDGGTAPADPGAAGGESDLDFDIAIPIIYPQKTSLYEIGDTGTKDSFDAFMDAFVGPYCADNGDNNNSTLECGDLKQPNAISISWGSSEQPTEVAQVKRQCTEWMKFGLAGTSVIASSGDDGVSGPWGCLGDDGHIFTPDVPCGCPYITSVGATTLPPGAKVGDVEIATTSFASGGGFSNIYARPDWQNDVVATYLDKHVPNYKSYNTTDGKIPSKSTDGVYNRGGRGYPDVSMNGDNGVVVTNGVMFLNGGTSMSSPMFASVITLINEERLNAGKKSLGFLNPALYKAYAKGAFTDIVKGDQSPRGTTCGSKNGFVASPGWDPVTGLGTPKYDKMREYFGQL